ncbi:MbnP family protein [Flavihumibacter fluvii]|uniref:MbnP family protein n=1 Tax=Flavihumibacter fluvii TaxID=2838157 RepID=UPI001BDE15B3|nr:MbnP family protein [Flavihumibacter fluvii]ULQ51283.1 hypothetical protein KJS93_14425 [Flavihumibacter fluvii]
MRYFFMAILAAATLFTSCSKSKEPDFQAGDTGSLDIEFDNVVGGQNLQLNTGVYTNSSGESFTITTLNYFISNIVLKNADGSEYIVPRNNCYFLIKEENASQLISLDNIPAGNYNGLSFILGVDSLKNTEPIENRTGSLDPAGEAAGMYWVWNSGYIFLKMEGTSTVLPATDNAFFYHIGGFGGYSSPTINNIKSVSLTSIAGSVAEVRKNKADAPHVHILADALKVLNGPTPVSIAANPMVMFSPYSVNIANNYQSMFSIDHIHND